MRRLVQAALLVVVGLLFINLSQAAAPPPGQWVVISLDHIEITPSQEWFTAEGIWFGSPTPYQTQFNCSRSDFISIVDPTLMNRALSVALYAKSAGSSMKVYVTGCDSRGVLVGQSVMLID